MARAVFWCRVHLNFGLKSTPKYLYEATGLVCEVVTELSGLCLFNESGPGIGSLNDLGKFISAVLDNSKGELCVRDHANPPLGCSIMSFNFV